MSVRFGEKKTGLVIEKALIILRNETELPSHVQGVPQKSPPSEITLLLLNVRCYVGI